MAKDVLTDNLSAPLGGATTARVDIHSDAGHLTIDRLSGDEPVLANGTLQYFEKQGIPTRALTSSNGQATLSVRGGGARSGFRFPWAACAGGAYEWLIHLNPKVATDITAYTGGGNVHLDLAGMAVTHLVVESGGGNMDVILPDNVIDFCASVKSGGGNVTVEVGSGITGSNTVTASSGAGNVEVRVPGDVAARVQAKSGLGKVIVDSRLGQIDKSTYETPDYEGAANRVEITANSGAGNVTISVG